MEGELLEEMEVENGLLQGCTMAPTFFILYACVVSESWLCRMHDVEGVGTYLLYKPDQPLLSWYTKNAREDSPYKCEFVDMLHYWPPHTSSKNSYLGILFQSRNVWADSENLQNVPMTIDGGCIECVKELQYLGSLIAADGRIDIDADKRLANASKAFGALLKAIFTNTNLSLTAKRQVY